MFSIAAYEMFIRTVNRTGQRSGGISCVSLDFNIVSSRHIADSQKSDLCMRLFADFSSMFAPYLPDASEQMRRLNRGVSSERVMQLDVRWEAVSDVAHDNL
jgi:hypothetical protein